MVVYLNGVGVGGAWRDDAQFAVRVGTQLSDGADLDAVVALVEPHPCATLQRGLHTTWGKLGQSVVVAE